MRPGLRFAWPTPAGREPGAIRRVLPGIVLLAFVVRLVVVLVTPHFKPVNDAAIYDDNAVSLARTGAFPPSLATFHGGPTAYHPPGFSYALALVYKLVGTGQAHTRWEAGRIMEALLGTLVVALIAAIGARVWSARVGLLAAGIAAVYPPLVLAGSSLLSESLFIPLMLGATWAALIGREDERLRWTALAGALVGLATLTRANGLPLLIPIACLTWVGRPRRRWRSLRAPLTVAATLVIVLVPWTVRNAERFHQFVLVTTETGYTLEGTYNAAVQHDARFPAFWNPPLQRMVALYRADPHTTEAQASDTLDSDTIDYIEAHPGSVLRTVYWNTLRLLDVTPGIERFLAPAESYPTWLAMLSVYTFWLLLAIALAGAAMRATRRAPLALWGLPLVIYLSTAPVIALTRYRMPADPFLILAAAIALLAAWDRLHAHRAGSAPGLV